MINYLNAGILLIWLAMSAMSFGAWYLTKIDQFLICAILANIVLYLQAYITIKDYKRQNDILSSELLRIYHDRIEDSNVMRILHAAKQATDQDKQQ